MGQLPTKACQWFFACVFLVMLKFGGPIKRRPLRALFFTAASINRPLTSALHTQLKQPLFPFGFQTPSSFFCTQNQDQMKSSFRETASAYVPELDVNCVRYKHLKSNAEVMLLQANEKEQERVFAIALRTPVSDNTGVAHIIEHSVFCGSKKFPSKEPFTELLKGSSHTYLNALTYSDRTIYPAASVIEEDFFNIFSVYMDAVFQPRARTEPLVLKQEGWHYELKNSTAPLERNGVVLNEMKGVYSNPIGILGNLSQKVLFPHNAYQHCSGGMPKDIPTLNFDAFKKYYESHYVPSNSQILVWAPRSDRPEKYLDFIDSCLSDIESERQENHTPVACPIIQKKQNLEGAEGFTVKEQFPCSPGDEQDFVVMSFLLNEEALSLYDNLALRVLDHLMVGSPAAPIYKTLTKSGLGTQFLGGLESELRQLRWMAGLKGVKQVPGRPEEVKKLLLSSLQTLADDGFSDEAFNAAINTVEFGLRERNTGSSPKGLSILLSAAQQWNYGWDPVDSLRFEEPLTQLKKDVAQGKPVFQNLLKRYFIENKHRGLIHMEGNSELHSNQKKEEEVNLSDIKSDYSPEDIENVMAETKRLLAAQTAHDTPEDLARIPRLTIESIEKKIEEIPAKIVPHTRGQVVTHDIPSAGILYADVGLDMGALTMDQLRYIPIYCQLSTEIGTSKMNETELVHHIGATTGGIDAQFMVAERRGANGTVGDPDEGFGTMFFHGKAFEKNMSDLFQLYTALITDVNFDNKKRAQEIVKEKIADIESALVVHGHRYALKSVSAQYSVAAYVRNQLGGIPQLEFLRELDVQIHENWEKVFQTLVEIRDRLSKSVAIVNLTADQKLLDNAKEHCFSFFESLPSIDNTSRNSYFLHVLNPTNVSYEPPRWIDDGRDAVSKTRSGGLLEGFAVPTKVNYVVKGGRMFPPGKKVPPNLAVPERALESGYLWDEVRVIGGAYGAFFRVNRSSGCFEFVSYRDPNLMKTLAAYDAAGATCCTQPQFSYLITTQAPAWRRPQSNLLRRR
eukprot:GHVN01066565.1.p1 GENE.GHVN01066565.1~~GHVN01066565.1.p1  ORF type:complete len:1019 (-),score=58.64 GHVN01066565.1:458-3514(-)